MAQFAVLVDALIPKKQPNKQEATKADLMAWLGGR